MSKRENDDPRERHNLATQHPDRAAELLDALLEEQARLIEHAQRLWPH
ncbi:MAG: hypothetical protein ACNA8W_16190 [Bradymonadaceae bacterium]